MTDNSTKAQCKHCFNFLSSGSNSTSMNHIMHSHCEALKTVSEARQSSMARDESVPDVLREQFAGLVIQQGLPFNHFDNAQMTRVFQNHMQPKYNHGFAAALAILITEASQSRQHGSSGLRRFFRYAMLSIHSIYVMSLYLFTERYAQPYFFSCFIRQVRICSVCSSIHETWPEYVWLGEVELLLQPRDDAIMAAKWGVLGWIVNNNSSPLIESYSQASADLVVFHNVVVFEALNSIDNYLRIQDETLTGDLASADIATTENMNICLLLAKVYLINQLAG
uniref:Patatin-like protein 1 n=1 Tax=Tanacetum cinerariifolium TaxID=118510 RepID=A0A6L2JTV1_TANCI|nr:patatin-like protein 1 [Tanacetum cinerariifolium]